MMKAMLVMSAMGAMSAWGQRPAVPAAGAPTLACGQPNATDTVVSTPDGEGYISLFDGTTFKGWFQSCVTAHGGPAVMRINTTDRAIYHASNNNTGGLMMTNKTYGNYELYFEWWPTYGNDGGIFNRTNQQGYCYQTVLDYLGGASVGGVWAERGISQTNSVPRDIRPWRHGGATTLNFPNDATSWTNVTRLDPNRASYGCPANGCVSADFARLWDANGWVQMRIKFYGGLTAGTRIQMASFFKRPSSNVWVPIYHDSTLTDGPIKSIPAGFIGIQVHAGGSFQSGNNGNFYRNIKWRPIDNQGRPLVTGIRGGSKAIDMKIRSSAGALQGSIDEQHEIIVKDLKGKVLESFSGGAGDFRYAFSSQYHGMMVVQVKTLRSTRNFKIMRYKA